MQTNLNIQQIINKLKFLIKNNEIIDIILFGSFIKGKINYKDIDICIIFKEKIDLDLIENLNKKFENMHFSTLILNNLLINPPTLVNTLLREGYSLKNKKYLAELFSFTPKILFKYDLISLNSSKKVRVVNILRGTKKEKGLVEKNKGEWMANQVFTIPIDIDNLFEEFFDNFNVKFKKYYLLMH